MIDPLHCQHRTVEPVENFAYGLVANLCVDCGTQLEPDWLPPQPGVVTGTNVRLQCHGCRKYFSSLRNLGSGNYCTACFQARGPVDDEDPMWAAIVAKFNGE